MDSDATEGSISSIPSLNTPGDAGKSDAAPLIFKSASQADTVWKSFLPSDYKDIISDCVSPNLPRESSAKDLYLGLCGTPLRLKDSNLSFRLDKWSGKKCYMLGARKLKIAWEENPNYWKWRSPSESESSRFEEVAELLNVCWLGISGKMDTSKLSPETNYAAYFVYKIMGGAYGLRSVPAEVRVKLTGGGGGGGDGEARKVFLSVPKKRSDGWMEIEMGEFSTDQGNGEVEMSLEEVKGLHWKSGIIVEGIELRPKLNKIK